MYIGSHFSPNFTLLYVWAHRHSATVERLSLNGDQDGFPSWELGETIAQISSERKRKFNHSSVARNGFECKVGCVCACLCVCLCVSACLRACVSNIKRLDKKNSKENAFVMTFGDFKSPLLSLS